MAKFNLKEHIAKNKATFFGSLTEGQFSWMTQDTGQQIGSQEGNTIPVYMFDDKGKYWFEPSYDGYGVFGGMDYYELLDQMNGGRGDRSEGIRKAFDPTAEGKLLFPALVVSPNNFNYKTHDFTKEAETDPDQSWLPYEEDNKDDYDDYGMGGGFGDMDKPEDYDDEDDMMEGYDEFKRVEKGKKKTVAKDKGEEDVYGAGVKKGEEIEKKKMKMSEFKAKIKEMVLAEYEKDVNITNTNPENEVDFLAELENMLNENSPMNDPRVEQIISMLKGMDVDGETMEYILRQVGMEDQMANQLVNYPAEYAASLNEGVWSVLPARIPEFIAKVEELKDEYHGVVGSDDVYDGLDMAIRAAEQLMTLREAEGDTEKDTAETDTETTTDVAVDDTETTDVTTTAEVDPNVKAVQDSLTQAQAAAQQLGDKKLIDQIGNTITFFTRAHVVEKPKGGAVAENLNESMFPMLKKILK
jgi:hypothetical protein